MKRLFLLYFLLFLFTAETNAQLKGRFCDSRSFSSTCIEFINKKEFEYSFSDCTSENEGTGTYKFKRNELKLTFINPKPKNRDNIVKINDSESKEDSVSFKIFVFDKIYSSPLSFITIALLGKDGKIISVNYADLNGISNFSLPKTNEAISIEIEYIGYEKCSLPILLNKNYQIEIGLASAPIEVIKPGTIWKWKIKSLSENEFIVLKEEEKVFKK